MPNINVLKQNGEKAGTLALSDTVFGAEYNEPLIHQVVVAQLANLRQGSKSSLTRAEVRGGGKKPWRQKHTGRARQGSTRSPQWTHGGVVFAPKPRDFTKKINKSAKDSALKSALSAKLAGNELVVVDSFTMKEIKTKAVAQMLKALKIDKSVLFITGKENADILRASGNIPAVTVTESSLINVYDIVRHEKCLILKEAVKSIEEAYKE